MVQVDILPEESRRLRDELDKYVDSQPTKTELSPDPNTPLYQPQDNSGVELYSGESESITVTDLAPVAPVPVMAVQAPVVEAPQQPIKAQAATTGCRSRFLADTGRCFRATGQCG